MCFWHCAGKSNFDRKQAFSTWHGIKRLPVFAGVFEIAALLPCKICQESRQWFLSAMLRLLFATVLSDNANVLEVPASSGFETTPARLQIRGHRNKCRVGECWWGIAFCACPNSIFLAQVRTRYAVLPRACMASGISRDKIS